MNTNIQTMLSNILAPLTGENSDVPSGNAALFDPKNSEFGEIVRKIQATSEKRQSNNTSEQEDVPSVDDVLSQQVSSKPDKPIANKEKKSGTDDPGEIETALSDLATITGATPEQIENLENLPINGEIPHETMETIQGINDSLVSGQQIGTEQTAPMSETNQTMDGTTTSEAVIIPIPETMTDPKQPEPIAQNHPVLPIENVETNLPKSAEITGQPAEQTLAQLNIATAETKTAGETAEQTLSQLNIPATETANSDTQQQSQSDSNSGTGNTIARQVAKAIVNQQQADSEAADQIPLRQISPLADQILNSATDKADRPLVGDILQDINNTHDTIAEEPIGTNFIDTTAPTTDSPVLSKTDGPAVSNAEIARQVQETISSSVRAGDKQVVIRLDPPELGQVTMRFIEKPEGITGILQVDQAQTRQEIERALPEIIQNLQNASVQIKKVEVVQTPQQHFDNSRDESAFSGQESGFQQQGDSHSQPHQSSYTEHGIATENPVERQTPDMQWTNESINMLI